MTIEVARQEKSKSAMKEHIEIVVWKISLLADQVIVLPYNSKLRAVALSISPYHLSSYSVTVEFNGRKYVSDNQGIFLAVNKSPLIVAMTGCNMFAIVASYIISKVYS
uniref:Uncharacterized protein n=1 Tax=Magallana gigas TaxID=29159 RepID=A0A8W8MSI1_MAGGI